MPASFADEAAKIVMQPLLHADEIIFSYEEKSILDRISLSLYPKELVTLIGPNGAGKTTLLRILSGLLSPQQGNVTWMENTQPIPLSTLSALQISRRLAMIEQHIHPNFDFTVEQLVAMGRYPHHHFLSLRSIERLPHEQDKIQEALERTGLSSYRKRKFFTLSSGEKQRTWIALALCQEPKVLILDEPLSYLDLRYQAEIFALLQQLASQGLAVLLTVHDLNWAAYADKVALLADGNFLVGNPTAVLVPSLLSQAFHTQIEVLSYPESGLASMPLKRLWIQPTRGSIQ